MAREKKGPAKGEGKMMSNLALGSQDSAAARGLGGSLLLGFSTCKPADWDDKGGAAVEGFTYVVPLHRLRAVVQEADKIKWHFEPMAGPSTALPASSVVDIIEMAIDMDFQTEVWNQIASIIGGWKAGNTFVWVQNFCSRGATAGGSPIVIPNVTDITITIYGAS